MHTYRLEMLFSPLWSHDEDYGVFDWHASSRASSLHEMNRPLCGQEGEEEEEGEGEGEGGVLVVEEEVEEVEEEEEEKEVKRYCSFFEEMKMM